MYTGTSEITALYGVILSEGGTKRVCHMCDLVTCEATGVYYVKVSTNQTMGKGTWLREPTQLLDLKMVILALGLVLVCRNIRTVRRAFRTYVGWRKVTP